jgi:hypothetical protein
MKLSLMMVMTADEPQSAVLVEVASRSAAASVATTESSRKTTDMNMNAVADRWCPTQQRRIASDRVLAAYLSSTLVYCAMGMSISKYS